VFGRDAWAESPRVKEEIGYLPGDLRVWPDLSPRSALKLLSRVRRRDLFASGSDLASAFELDLDLCVRRMSRGTRQKLGLVLALAHRPRLAVLDEPTTGLDPVMQERLREELRRLAGAGHTVFFSSHVLAEVSSLCDRVAILRAGRIVEQGPVESLRHAAGREVRVLWRSDDTAARLPELPGLDVVERRGRECLYAYSGSTEPLLRWLAEAGVEDVSIGAADLESLFHRHYKR
jgi:ABC-2 type transport system ATP-binding protein